MKKPDAMNDPDTSTAARWPGHAARAAWVLLASLAAASAASHGSPAEPWTGHALIVGISDCEDADLDLEFAHVTTTPHEP